MDIPRTSRHSFARFGTRLVITLAFFAVLPACNQADGTKAKHSNQPSSFADLGSAEDSKQAASALPSMSAYTLKRIQQNRSSEEAVDVPGGSELAAARQYCFRKSGAASWLSMRLSLSMDQQLTGESVGVVNHREKGAIPYQQTFEGSLTGTQAAVGVTTEIAGVIEQRQEAWDVDTRRLDMGRVVIDEVPCLEIAADF